MTEYFDVVDENNSVIGRATRDECHKNGLWHRAVHIIIVNSRGQLLLQKRSMNKDLYKGYWIDAAAGHVNSGESYEECADRELMEELGIKTNLKFIFGLKKYTKNDNEFIRVFLGNHDGPFEINKDEIDFVKFFFVDEIKKLIDVEPFVPASYDIFEIIKNNHGILKMP